MLISKWAVLKAVVDAYPMLSVFIAFGSAATLFFWVKWMGKLVEVVGTCERIKKELVLGEAIALYGLSAATALACLLFPLISTYFIAPYVAEVYFQSAALPTGDIIGRGNTIIMIIMMAMVMLFPITFFNYGRGVRVTDAYLGGANLHSSTRFLGSASAVENVTMHNYYLRGILSEPWLSRWGVMGSTVLLAAMFLMAFL
jgi:ech hydrogenase subunit A